MPESEPLIHDEMSGRIVDEAARLAMSECSCTVRKQATENKR